MASFLYFFPQTRINTVKDIHAKHGLADVLNGASLDVRKVLNNGCGGLDGTVVSAHTVHGKQPITQYSTDTQVWSPVVDADDKVLHWIGYEKEHPPTPQDLERAETVSGCAVQIKGQEWIVPVVHAPLSTLPRSYRMTGQGVVGGFNKRYETLMQEAERWFRYVSGDEVPNSFDFAAEYYFAVSLLNVNYRIGRWEASKDVMDLLQSQDVVNVIYAGLGVSLRAQQMDAVKKNEDTSTNTPDS